MLISIGAYIFGYLAKERKKNVKSKIFAMLLVLVMVLSMAAGVSAAESAAKLSLSVTADSTETTVCVSLIGGEGMTNGRFAVGYDADAVTLKSVRASEASAVSSVNDATAGTVSYAWVGSDLTAEETLLLTLVFEHRDGAQDVTFTAEGIEPEMEGTSVTVNVAPFVDIEGHWAEAEIIAAYNAGLVNGIGGGYFAPDTEVNRAAFVTMLYRMADEPALSDLTTAFVDVPADSFYGAAVKWAVDNGITNGVSATAFAPGKAISRQEMMTMLWRYAKNVEGRDVSASADLGTFTDGNTVASWAEAAMSWALAEALLEGYPDGTVQPATTAVRAQAAAIFCRYMAI